MLNFYYNILSELEDLRKKNKFLIDALKQKRVPRYGENEVRNI